MEGKVWEVEGKVWEVEGKVWVCVRGGGEGCQLDRQ